MLTMNWNCSPALSRSSARYSQRSSTQTWATTNSSYARASPFMLYATAVVGTSFSRSSAASDAQLPPLTPASVSRCALGVTVKVERACADRRQRCSLVRCETSKSCLRIGRRLFEHWRIHRSRKAKRRMEGAKLQSMYRRLMVR
jgi:hypothetical protein